jgi:hypothetical protein
MRKIAEGLPPHLNPLPRNVGEEFVPSPFEREKARMREECER